MESIQKKFLFSVFFFYLLFACALCCSGLPDEKGRVDILKIHTKLMKESNLLHDNVNLDDLASKTKNFSGAELEGLVRCAVSTAMNSLIKVIFLLNMGM